MATPENPSVILREFTGLLADSGRLTLFDLLTPEGPEAILCPLIDIRWYRPLRGRTSRSGEDLGLWPRVFLPFESKNICPIYINFWCLIKRLVAQEPNSKINSFPSF